MLLKLFQCILIFHFVIFFKNAAYAKDDGAEDSMSAGTLDGVVIKAIETYPNPRKSEVNLGVSLYPYNAYYNGFGLNGSYTHYYNKEWAWDVVNGTIFFPMDKDLTATLAEEFGVEPERIERVKFLASSNLKYVHSYGKLVFLKKYIRYYRSSLILGGGLASTNHRNYLTGNFGIDFSFYLNETFSVKFEAIDNMALTGSSLASPNYLLFKISTGISY